MKKISQKELKKELIKIINKDKIDEVIYEPRYTEGYENNHILIGSIITIRTSLK